MKGELTMEKEMNLDMDMDIIDTTIAIEEVGPGTPACIAACVAGCGTTSGFGTLGSVTVGVALL